MKLEDLGGTRGGKGEGVARKKRIPLVLVGDKRVKRDFGGGFHLDPVRCAGR